PANLCQICDPSADPGGWTPLLAGNSCGSAEVCAEGTCVSGCSIDGVGYPAGASGSNPCLVCDPAVSPASWTPGANDAPCGSASFCRGGACVRGCEVGGAFVAAGAVAPTDPCASCLPEESSTSYSFSPDGTACSDGQGGTFCESGQCAPVCVVDGGAFTAGSADPAAACFACQPASNPFAFTAITGAVPPGGCPSKEDVCLSGSCAEGCFINGGYLPSGSLAAGGADAGELCCSPLYSTAGWTPQWAELSVGGGAGLTGVFPAQLASGPGVITANESAQTVTLLPSLGNGLLGPGTTYAAGHAVQVAGVGDMDGDGVPDIVVSGSTYYYSNYVTVLPGVDGGGVGAPVTSALGNTNLIGVVPHFFPTAPRAAALFFGWDANNFPLDVVALTDAGYGVVQTTHVGFFVDNARAGQQVVIADFNGDGFEDLGVTSNAYVQDVAVLLSSGTGSLGGEVDFLSGHDAEGLGAGSIFGSHYASGAPVLDLVTYDGTTGAFVVFRNDGNGNFTQWASTAIAGIPSVVSMAAGDFNGDGWGDAAALIGTNPYTVQIFLGDGSGTFTPGPTFSTQINSSSYAGGMAMLGGQYGPGGGDAFFSITSNSGASMWQDACR
ncbi:MAG TPA: VCBS repeat-containing protein, partial [Myxococcales bacterium]|nr:VCBS repeat-containing protein [Myxococcales bacterium]